MIDGKSRNTTAHKMMYESEVGLVPKGLVLDHLCMNPPCINPAHLEPVTNKENLVRGMKYWERPIEKYCSNGHLKEGDNLFITKDGFRKCRKCSKEGKTRYHRKQNPLGGS